MIDSRAIRLLLVLFLMPAVTTFGLRAQAIQPAVSKPGPTEQGLPKQGGRPANFPIAVVDVGRASVHTKAMKGGLEELQKMHASYQAALGALSKQLESLDLEISLMKIASPEKMDKQIEMSGLIRRRDASKKLYDAALTDRRTKMDVLVYREIDAALAELAKKNGILLVLRKRAHTSTAEILKQGGTAEEATKRQIGSDRLRDVLYHAPAIDLTDDLIKYLKG
jgi:Skp family chaperone for outer membrane proteins